MEEVHSPWSQYNRAVVVKGDSCVDHDIVIQPSYQNSRQPYPHVVEILVFIGTPVFDSTIGCEPLP